MIIETFAAARDFQFQDSIAGSFCYTMSFKELSPRPFTGCELCVTNEARAARSIHNSFEFTGGAILQGN
jgi:hypothetical protein